MVATSPLGLGLGLGQVIQLPLTTTFKKHYNHNSNNSNISSASISFNLNKDLSSKSFGRFNLGCCCNCSVNEYEYEYDYDTDWDWNRWIRHINEIEQADSFTSLLKFQLEEAVEREDFQEAVKLKSALAEASAKDTVAEIMSELKKAIAEERYHYASKLSRNTGSGLVGWWIGSAKDSGDPFGRLVRITPGVGKFIGRAYTPRQLVTASPGTTLFEIYVVKSPDGTYAMQVVYMQRSKGNSTISANLQPKPTRESTNDESDSETSSTLDVDAQTKEDKTEKQEERVLNIEGATEEGIKSVINFLKDRIPGLNVKVMNISVADEVVNELNQEDSEEDSDEESTDLDETDSEDDRITMEDGNRGNTNEDGNGLDMKVFVRGIVHSEDEVSLKEEYVRLPAQISNAEKDSFMLHVPGIRKSPESEAADYKIAPLAAQGASELMPADVAKAFLGSDKLSPKISRDVRDMVRLAVSQAQKRNRLTEYTMFDRIKIPRNNLDPFDGLYVGAFGPYGTEIVQLKRKYGRWSNGDESDKSSDIEFYEYVEAIKLTGDLNVPAGQVTFRAKIGKGSRLSKRGIYPDELGVITSYKGQGRIAEFGFKNPKWVEGELLQLSGKGIGPYIRGADLGFLYIVPEQSFLVIFNRLNLPE